MEENSNITDNVTASSGVTDTCYGRVRSVDWNNAALVVSFVVLGLINVMVIAGNTLVILAVFIHSKLRTVTNLFIVSLAVSDLLVGVAVLPFSTTYEVLDVWFFGGVWCQMWLAVDVWMCTASILNLCAISLDRYLAVSRPVSYPSIMSSKRAKVLIALVWCVSFIICLPPLVGWNDSRNRGPGAPNFVNVAPSPAPPQQFPLPLDPRDFRERASTMDRRSILETGPPQLYPQSNELDQTVDEDIDESQTGGQWAGNGQSDLLSSNRIAWEGVDYVLLYNDTSQEVFANNGTVLRIVPEVGGDARSSESGGSHTIPSSVSGGPGSANPPGGTYTGGIRGFGLHTAVVNMTAMCVCQLISDKGYRIYSSLGSFYLPMLVMMFFYWRIYRAAVETTRAINQGFRTTKSGSSIGGRFDEQRLTLRIHRGKSTSDLYSKANGATHDVGHSSFRSGGSKGGRMATAHLHHHHRHRHHAQGEVANRTDNMNTGADHRRHKRHGASKVRGSSTTNSPASSSLLTSKSRKPRKPHWMLTEAHVKSPATHLGNDGSLIATTEVTDHLMSPGDGIVMATSVTITGRKSPTVRANEAIVEAEPPIAVGTQLFSKMGKRNIKAQVKRFKMETKAAKTLGIIVGGFILCWLPFFTIYLIGAFCEEDCIPDSLFSVFFWLGYCNSAINPCVYALFSRDFRHAFKKILCRCALRDDHNVKERIVTMFPTMQLTSFFEESEEGSNSH